jgi:hypothetical protein
MKKIWNIRILLAIAALCVLFYSSFMQDRVDRHSHPGLEYTGFSIMMAQKYGTTLDTDELSDFMETRDMLVTEAEQYISADPVFAAAEIYSYADYTEVNNQDNEKWTDVQRNALFTFRNCRFWLK